MSDSEKTETSPALTWVVEAGKIAEFARAVLNPSPAHEGDDAVASPTFPQSMALWRARAPRPESGTGRGGLDMRRVLHGEQEFEYVRPLRPGDVLTATSHVKDRFEKEGKRGGTMTFIVSETVFRDQSGEIVAYSRGTTIQTSKAATS
jgi:acyl dehydratase